MTRWIPRVGLALLALAFSAPADAGNPVGVDPKPNLVVRKVSVFGNALFNFSAEFGAFNIQTAFGEGEKEFALAPGIYHVTETLPTGWTQVSNGCKTVVVPAPPAKVTCEVVNMMMMGMQSARVHVKKYLDGKPATAAAANNYAFPMKASWQEPNAAPKSETYTLGPDSYVADSAPLMQGSKFLTSELTNDISPSSKVLPPNCDCEPGKFQLIGYSVSDVSFADAADNPISPSPLPFNNVTADLWVVVHNKTCVKPGWLKVIKQTTGGDDGTFTFGITSTPPVQPASFSITTTGGVGFKTLELPAGTYEIAEDDAPGWTEFSSTCESVVVEPGKFVTCTVVNKPRAYYGEIRGRKCQDVNGDGNLADCKPLAGWTIYLDTNKNGSLDPGEVSTTTNANGRYRFQNLPTGTYVVREVLKPGWIQTFPASGKHQVTLSAGQVVKGKNFGNLKCDYGRIGGVKFEDKNCNGWRDHGEQGLANWTIVLKRVGSATQVTTTTNHLGEYEFDNLAPGTYLVTEVQKTGWIQTTLPHPPIVVKWGSNIDDVDFGNRRVW